MSWWGWVLLIWGVGSVLSAIWVTGWTRITPPEEDEAE